MCQNPLPTRLNTCKVYSIFILCLPQQCRCRWTRRWPQWGSGPYMGLPRPPNGGTWRPPSGDPSKPPKLPMRIRAETRCGKSRGRIRTSPWTLGSFCTGHPPSTHCSYPLAESQQPKVSALLQFPQESINTWMCCVQVRNTRDGPYFLSQDWTQAWSLVESCNTDSYLIQWKNNPHLELQLKHTHETERSC